jgi:hypothetical protein
MAGNGDTESTRPYNVVAAFPTEQDPTMAVERLTTHGIPRSAVVLQNPDFAELLRGLPAAVNKRGRAFERICQWYLHTCSNYARYGSRTSGRDASGPTPALTSSARLTTGICGPYRPRPMTRATRSRRQTLTPS